MRFFMNMTVRAERGGAARRLLCLALCLLMLWGEALAATVSKEEAMTIGLISVTTDKLNPLMPQERDFMALSALVYEGLVSIDDNYEPQPSLAQRWESSASGGTWTFTLREGVTFHDGTPLTANDVVATLNEILRLAADETNPNKGAYASLQYMVTKASATDLRTVSITTRRSNYGFLYAMTFPILPTAALQANDPPGTGPYRLSSFVPKDYLLLSANDSWWGGLPRLKEIMAICHVTNRDLVSSYEYNRVDAIITRSMTAAQYRSGLSTINLSYRTRQLETLLMNNRARELTDVRVRKAIRMAINIDALASSTYMNLAMRSDTPMIPGTWMYRDEPGAVRYDPEGAKALLDEAGWLDLPDDDDTMRKATIDGAPANLKLRFIVYEEPDNAARISIAHQIAGMLASVGVNAEVLSMSFKTAKERLKANTYDLALVAYNMDAVPDPGFLLMSGNTGNYMRYASERMDALFSDLRLSMDRGTYQQKLFEIQALMLEDCPLVCLYYRNGAILSRRMFTDARNIREPEVLRGIEKGID
ncbi:MAG: ABC transporter substrate-binding protein [Christensenellales bacterium]